MYLEKFSHGLAMNSHRTHIIWTWEESSLPPLYIPYGYIQQKSITNPDVENFHKFKKKNVKSVRNFKTTLPNLMNIPN
jgi:hypothetical protein